MGDGMKKGEIIHCHNEKDLKQMLRDLDIAGFGAVVMGVNTFDVRITSVPDTEYLVQGFSNGGAKQSAYCDTLEEAEEVAFELGNQYEFVEISKGYPGEWETVSQCW